MAKNWLKRPKNLSFMLFYFRSTIKTKKLLKKFIQKLRTIFWYLKTGLSIVILQENGCFSWFLGQNTLSFCWNSYFVAEYSSVLHYTSNKVQWSCLLWSADFIDPLYTKSSHCALRIYSLSLVGDQPSLSFRPMLVSSKIRIWNSETFIGKIFAKKSLALLSKTDIQTFEIFSILDESSILILDFIVVKFLSFFLRIWPKRH